MDRRTFLCSTGASARISAARHRAHRPVTWLNDFPGPEWSALFACEFAAALESRGN